MSPNSSSSDVLLAQYEQAKAALPDGLPDQPSAATRERIMLAARTQVDTINSIALSAHSIRASSLNNVEKTSLDPLNHHPAANDSFWNIKAVASLAVMGLSGLLWWQFERGTPEEQLAATSSLPAAAAPTAAPPAASEAKLPALIPSPTSPRAAVPAPIPTPIPMARPAIVKPLPESVALEKGWAISQANPSPVLTQPDAQVAPPSARADAPTVAASPAPAPGQTAAAESNLDAQESAVSSPAMRSAKPQRLPQASQPSPQQAKSFDKKRSSEIENFVRLESAIRARDLALLKQEVALGVSPDATNGSGETALHVAVRARWADGVRYLSGANPSAKNLRGQTAADLALELGYSDLVALIAESLAAPK